MTPLPRWVFLTVLFVSTVCFAAQRNDDACVRLCRAQKRNPAEFRGIVCDYKRHVLQSDGGHSAIQRLLRYCLTPCNDLVSSQNQLYFEDSRYCQSFRDYILESRGCSCRTFDVETTARYENWKDTSWLDRLYVDYVKYELNGRDIAGERYSENSLRELETGVGAKNDYQDTLSARHRLSDDKKETMNVLEVDQSNSGSEEESQEVATMAVKPGSESPSVVDPDSTEEPSIDWELWCMAQCDNGQGGSACNCDIIP